MMRIQMDKPGILTTIQDLGRWQSLAQAVPLSGAMDSLAARLANKALGNADENAVIEFTYAAAAFSAETDILIAYTGEGAFLTLNQQKIPTNRAVFIPAGSHLKLVNNPSGARTYLAIAGGFNVPQIMGSRSTCLIAGFGGLEGRTLQTGDILEGDLNVSDTTKALYDHLKGRELQSSKWYLPVSAWLNPDRKTIRVVPAQEFTSFNSRAIIDFLSLPFSIGLHSNRMGYRLEGVSLNRLKKQELLSTAVTPGTIQVTGDGQIILLMADCQTTGGYPRIARVASVDLPLCAQLKPGDRVRFTEISAEDAEMLYIEREEELARLTLAIHSKF